MSKRDTYESRTEQLLLPIVESNGFELVDVEYVKEGSNWYLRAYIDKPGGITIDDCEVVSRALSDLMDKDDFIEDSYILEVSSPGLLRPLKKDKDFARHMGKDLEIRTFKMIDKKKEFIGTLLAYDGDTITVKLEDEKEMIFARKEIALVRPAIDFD
ncbi:MAG: ribosome maturation factor RimP [Lachnospiraceae bacterium]|nr:ribosome maturation factor RimP [Lachnospiraceae bacterium]